MRPIALLLCLSLAAAAPRQQLPTLNAAQAISRAAAESKPVRALFQFRVARAAKSRDGYYLDSEKDFRSAAIREFKEEVCIDIDPKSQFLDLGSIRQKGGKLVHAWAVEQDWDESRPLRSNTFSMEWPRGSGKFQEFPEVDRAQFFRIDEAKQRIKESQVPLLERLEVVCKGTCVP